MHMRSNLLPTLKTIGLSENEARVYIAALELGPSTAQFLAAKATISRPNTYIMIEALIKRGIMTSFVRGKKRLFAAEAPEKLYRLVERDLAVLEIRRKAIAEALPALSSLKGETARSSVSVADDKETIKGLIEEFLAAAKQSGNAMVSGTNAQLATTLAAAKVPTQAVLGTDGVIAVAGDTTLVLDLIGDEFGVIVSNKQIALALRALAAGNEGAASAVSRRAKEHVIA